MTTISHPFQPSGLLRNPHLQGIASRLPSRRVRIEQASRVLHDNGRSVLLQGGDALLLGWLSQQPRAPQTGRPLVVLIHGWEGSSDSLYLLATATEAYHAGFDVPLERKPMFCLRGLVVASHERPSITCADDGSGEVSKKIMPTLSLRTPLELGMAVAPPVVPGGGGPEDQPCRNRFRARLILRVSNDQQTISSRPPCHR